MTADQQQYREWHESGKWREFTIDERPRAPQVEPAAPEPESDGPARSCQWDTCDRTLSKRQKRLCKMHAATERQRRSRGYWRKIMGSPSTDTTALILAVSEPPAFEAWLKEDAAAVYRGVYEGSADAIECLLETEHVTTRRDCRRTSPAIPADRADKPLTVSITLSIVDVGDTVNRRTAGDASVASDDEAIKQFV